MWASAVLGGVRGPSPPLWEAAIVGYDGKEPEPEARAEMLHGEPAAAGHRKMRYAYLALGGAMT